MTFNKKTVERVRNHYPKGSRVALVYMNDPYAPPVGTYGTVIGVDDLGTIHVDWDNLGCLGVVYGEDECVKLPSD